MLLTRDIKLAKHTENGDYHCILSSLCGNHPPPSRQNFSCLRNISFAKHALSQTLTLSLSLTLHPEIRENNNICFCVWKTLRKSLTTVQAQVVQARLDWSSRAAEASPTQRALCLGAQLRAGHATEPGTCKAGLARLDLPPGNGSWGQTKQA